LIGKTGSHGCFRLANWDAVRLGAMVRPGVPVEFITGDTIPQTRVADAATPRSGGVRPAAALPVTPVAKPAVAQAAGPAAAPNSGAALTKVRTAVP